MKHDNPWIVGGLVFLVLVAPVLVYVVREVFFS